MRRVLDIGHVVQTSQAVLFASCSGLYEVRTPLESKYDLWQAIGICDMR